MGLRTVFRSCVTSLCALALLVASMTPSLAVSGIRDTEIELMMREYADPIIEAAGLQPSSVRIYLLNDPSINAFVTAGSDMYIHTGLLLEADRPLQLIGVIAHETGHIAGGHVARIRDAFAAARTPLLVTMGLGLAAMAAGAPDAGLALLSSGQHIAERTILAHSRVQESSADQAAVTYLEKLGTSGRGLLEMTEKFRHMEVLSAANQNPYVRTHPLSSDRIASLQQRVAQSPYADKTETPEQMFAFEMMQAKLYAFLVRPELTYYRYKQTDTSLPSLYARAIAYYRTPDLPRALDAIDQLIAAMPDNAYFYELKGQVLFENGRAEEAIPWHKKSVELMPDAPLFRINTAQALLATEDSARSKEALDHLEMALRVESDNAFAWYLAATAYAQDGQIGQADLATAERYFNNRNMQPAIEFAKRARVNLTRGTPQWQRALDIIEIAATQQEDRRR